MKSTDRKAQTHRRSRKAQFVAVLAGLCVSSTSLVMAQTPAAPAQASESAAWKKITLSGLDFESPVSMQALEVPLEGPNAESVRKMIAKWESMQGEKDGVFTAASVVTYVPDAEVSLDGAVKGAMEGLAKNVGIPVPEYTSKETLISGQPARRIDSTFTTAIGGQDRKVNIRAVLVLSGKRLSQLMTIDMRSTPESAALAGKILDSASVVPAK